MLLYIVAALVALLALTTIGWGMAYALRLTTGIRSISDFLLTYVVGLYTTVMMYSIVKTSWSTINLIALVVFLLAYYYAPKVTEYKKPTFHIKPIVVSLTLFTGLSLVITNFSLTSVNGLLLYSSSINHDGGKDLKTSIPYYDADDHFRNVDDHFRNNISYYMNLTGEENEFHAYNLVSSDYHGTTPYHYSELWLNALVAECFGLNYNRSLLLVIPVLFYLMVFLSFLSLYQLLIGKLDLLGWLLCTGFLFFFGSARPAFLLDTSGVLFLQNLKDVPVWSNVKSAPYLLFTTMFLIFWYKEQRILAYLSLIFMSFMQFTSIPAVFGFLVLWLSYYGFYRKRTEEKTVFFCLVALSVLFIIQKSIIGNHILAREGTSAQEFLGELFSFSQYPVQRINILVKEVIYMLFKYHVIWLIMLIGWIKSCFNGLRQQPIFILSGICVAGLLLYALLFQLVNSEQLYQLFADAWIPVLFLLTAITAIKNESPLRKYLFLAFALMISINIYKRVSVFLHYQATARHSKEYISRINEYLHSSENTNVVGASFRNHGKEYSSYVTVYTLGVYLSQLKNGVCTISLSDLVVPVIEDPFYKQRAEKGYKLGWLYRRVQEQKKKGTFVSAERTQLDLLKEGKFQYAIFSKSYEIPKCFHNQIKEVCEDELSGDKFVIFKTKHL